jgi:F0F1-type ATP synthase membrane subunit a
VVCILLMIDNVVCLEVRFIGVFLYSFLTLVHMLVSTMSYLAMLTLAQLSISSTLSGGGFLTTSITMVLVTSCITIRAIDLLQTFQSGSKTVQATSLVLNENFLAHVLLIAIEDMSTAFRTLSLGFRYSANSTAGHILLHIVASLLISSSIAVILHTLSYIGLMLFECAVAVIQVGIYSVLISTYAGF